MVVLRAIGRFFARIGRWIKETAWIQPLLIVGGIFAIIFSIPYLTKWVKSWFNEDSASEKYFSSKKLSLKNAKDHTSDADSVFDYLEAYYNEDAAGLEKGKKKYGDKFFLTLVQDDCASCDERYDGFKTLEKEWGKGSFSSLSGETFKLHTIYVDAKDDDGNNLFEEVYERPLVASILEETISCMSGDYYDHPYKENSNDGAYVTNLTNLIERENISTPTTFVVDMTEQGKKDAPWISPHAIREVLFSFEGTDGSDAYAKARTLRNAWGNVDDKTNVYSKNYVK